MDLAAVMDELAEKLRTITGLRVFAFPPDDVTPPAAIVTYPDTYTYDMTYGRGHDRLDLGVVVVVGAVSDRASRDELARYADGSGTRSIKQAIESGEFTSFDSVRVMDAEFSIFTMAGVEYVAATFSLDVAGTGAA